MHRQDTATVQEKQTLVYHPPKGGLACKWLSWRLRWQTPTVSLASPRPQKTRRRGRAWPMAVRREFTRCCMSVFWVLSIFTWKNSVLPFWLARVHQIFSFRFAALLHYMRLFWALSKQPQQHCATLSLSELAWCVFWPCCAVSALSSLRCEWVRVLVDQQARPHACFPVAWLLWCHLNAFLWSHAMRCVVKTEECDSQLTITVWNPEWRAKDEEWSNSWRDCHSLSLVPWSLFTLNL